MTDATPQTEASRPGGDGIIFYGGAVGLMAAFVPGLTVWRQIQEMIGDSAAAVPVAAAALFIAALVWTGRKRPASIDWIWVGVGVLVAGGTLFLTDPDFPAKRIHVAEYSLLAVVLRRAVAPHASGWTQWALASLLGAVLGIHDEMIQGLHPDRTFGLRDITVNALSVVAGGLVAHGLGLWPGTNDGTTPGRYLVAGAGAVFIGAVLLIAVLPAFRDMATPVWTLAPLFAGAAAWSWASGGWFGRRGHPLSMAVWWCVLLPVYPLVTYVVPLAFH